MPGSNQLQRVYFMTGTGNSFRAATILTDLAKCRPEENVTLPTHEITWSEVKSFRHTGIIAFSYPTHGFSLPWHMLKFIIRFPRGKARVILINSRAGMKMGKLFTPGISGLALLLPMLILILKGYRISGVVPFDPPSNWISIHPGLRMKIIHSIFVRREAELSRLWDRISSGRTYYPLKFFLLLPIDIFLIPISLGYIFFGRFILARTYFADINCDGCGICAARCPVSAIKMVNNRPWWTYRCESCMRCSNICPKKSVNSSVPLMVIYTIVVLKISRIDAIADPLYNLISDMGKVPQEIIYYLALWIFTIVGTYIFYFVLFYLNRIRVFNYLIAYTTPMKYWRRYFAPGFNGWYRRRK